MDSTTSIKVTIFKVRLLVACIGACACAVPETQDDTAAGSGESSGPSALECVPATTPDFGFMMSPAPLYDSVPENTLRADCSVTDVTEGSSGVLQLSCMDGGGMLDWSLELFTAPVELTDLFADGDAVDLHYSTATPGEKPELNQWAVLRAPGEEDPLLVVIAAAGSPNGLPSGLANLDIEFVTDTDCESVDGSCGFGVMHRAAIEVSAADVGSIVVFDHNDGDLGSYRVHVGHAMFDEGTCDGTTMNRYVFMISRSDAAVDG